MAESCIPKSSYASLVDPEEGASLKYVPALIIIGVKCAKIKSGDVSPEINYWQSTVLCTILGVNPPLEVV